MKARKKKNRGSKVVERISAAANLAGVSEAVAKRAKALGCPAFLQGSRIDWPILKDWCAKNADKLKIDGSDLSLKDQKLNEEVRKLRRANEVSEQKLILKSDHEAEVREMAAAVQGVLYHRIDSLSVACAGQPAVRVGEILTAWVDDAVLKLSRGEMK